MNTDTQSRTHTQATTTSNLTTRAQEILFGDIGGVFVFLVVLAAAMLLWRFTFTINDNYVIANGLAALADGHLYVDEAVYGGRIDMPGMRTANGRAYPRNIGHIVFALPFLLIIEALTVVMAPQIAAAMLWSLTLLGAFIAGGRLFDHQSTGRLLGSGVAVLVFLASVALANTGGENISEFIALQLSTMVLAAFTAVLLYRVCSRAHDRRTGLAVGLAIGLATPALFWASVPKRHVVTTALAVVSLYFLYRSRETDSTTSYRRFRLFAYVPVGLTSWVFVGEGVLLLMALGLIDLVTARENGIRTLAGIAIVGVISAIPFFITNYLIAGDPLTSPMMLPDYKAPVDTGATPSSGGGTTAPSGSDSAPSLRGTSSESSLPESFQQLLYFVNMYRNGLEITITEPTRVYHTFIRSGFNSFATSGDGATGLAINLTYLESMPLAGALLGALVLLVRRLKRRAFDTTHAIDAFVVLFSVLTTLLYLWNLPIHAQLTVRYLYPLFPLAIYGLGRLPWVRDVLHDRAEWLTWTYVGSVVIGAQLALATLVAIDASIDEAMQGFALLSLAVATLLGLWSLAAAFNRTDTRIGAILLAIAAAIGTNLLLVTLIYYLGTGFALPLIPTL